MADWPRPVTLLLASASPRRRDLVRLLGLPVRVAPRDLDEAQYAVADPTLSALSIARAKARLEPRVAPPGGPAEPGDVMLAADTVVVHGDRALGKPADAAEARAMLRALRGGPHTVATGVVLTRVGAQRTWSGLVVTGVWMRTYSDQAIQAYVARGEPFDKAGGYAAQDPQLAPVERLDGCFLNVVGLPLCAVAAGLASLGIVVQPPDGQPPVPPCGWCRASGMMSAAIAAGYARLSPW